MSKATSEQNYKLAKTLYSDISDDFYEIENNGDVNDDQYLIDQTLDDIKKMLRYINRVNIDDLKDGYNKELLDILESNIDTFKEAGYFIERALMSMKLFDKIHPVLDEFIKDVDWKPIANTLEDAVMKFGRFLTNEKNYDSYKTIIGNIVKGTMNKKSFSKFFDQVSTRMLKPKATRTNKPRRSEFPPEMWPEEDQERWQAMKDERKKEATSARKNDYSQSDKFHENFMTLKDYKKLYEYYDYDSVYDKLANSEFGMDFDQLGPGEKEWVLDELDN